MAKNEGILGELFTKNERRILDVIMPGGAGFRNNGGTCLDNCPNNPKREYCPGPEKICYEENKKAFWTDAPAIPQTLQVIIHVFRTPKNFKYYASKDLDHIKGREDLRKKILKKAEMKYDHIWQPKKAEEGITERKFRKSQPGFRKDVINLWEKCAVTEIDDPCFLIASHIKPYHKASIKEKNDPYNALLLSPSLDFLFDSGFISFRNNGKILINDDYKEHCRKLGIKESAKIKGKLQRKQKKYLSWHRKHYGFK